MPSAGLKRELFTEGLILYSQLLKFCLLICNRMHVHVISWEELVFHAQPSILDSSSHAMLLTHQTINRNICVRNLTALDL